MADEPDVLEQLDAFLRKHKSEQASAQQAIFDLVVAKKDAESQRDNFKEMAVQRENALKEKENANGRLLEEMAVLKDKERARSQIIDALSEKLTKTEKRAEVLKRVLDRVNAELDEAYAEASTRDSEPEDPTVSKLKAIQAVAPVVAKLAGAEAELEQIQKESLMTKVAEVGGVAFYTRKAKDAVYGTRCALVRTLVMIGSIPFLLMTLSFALASQGIYIQIFRDFMAPWWAPWMGTDAVKFISVGVPVLLVTIWLVRCKNLGLNSLARYFDLNEREARGQQKRSERIKDFDEEPEPDDPVAKMLDEAFGDELEDAEGTDSSQ